MLSTAVSLNYKLINDYYIYKNIYLVYMYDTVIGNAKTHKLIDNLSFSRKNGGKENREVTRGIGIERE